jgi:hypothetical protein
MHKPVVPFRSDAGNIGCTTSEATPRQSQAFTQGLECRPHVQHLEPVPTADSLELAQPPGQPPISTCIDWYAEGQSRTVECGGVRMTVRFVGRKGRRGRIVIEAPAGAVFRADRG